MTDELQKISEKLQQRDYDGAGNLVYAFLEKNFAGANAEKVAELAVKLDGKNPYAFNILGTVFFNNGKYREAANAYAAALRINPEYTPAVLNLANLLYKLGQLKKAEEFYNTGLAGADKSLHNSIYRNLATIYSDRSMPEKALEILLPLFSESPKDAGLAEVIGNAYICMKNNAEAEKYYIKSLDLNDKSDSVHFNTARLYDRMKCFDKAAYHIDRAYEIIAGKYGRDYSGWPRDDKSLYDLYSFYELYHSADDNKNIFIKTDFDKEIADENLEYKKINERQSVVHVNDIYLDGNGWLFFKNKKIFENLTFTILEKYSSFEKASGMSGKTLTLPWDDAEIIGKPAVFLGGATNYYHWIVDFMPRLKMLESCPELSELPVLINEDIKKFQIESLKAIGFDMSRLIELSLQKRYLLKDVYILHNKNRRLTENNTPEWNEPAVELSDINIIRNTFAEMMKPDIKYPKRLFLSRKGAGFRVCLNEDEIFSIAREYGFEEVKNENMSFADQIALYSGVEVVMGVHGAGFTNMVFAPENATLIELHSLNELPIFYKKIAGLIGQTHIAIDGIVQETLRPAPQPFWNFEIDPAKVREVLEKSGMGK